MGSLAIPVEYNEKAVLIADDEPEHLEWLVEFLERHGLKVTVAVNVEQAMAASQNLWYRIYVIDLNIPLGGWPQATSEMFTQYPGFAIIQAIRSQGNDGRRVIAYSAHTNEQISAEMQRLYTDYIVKGRPIQLKERIRELLTQPDQTAAALQRANARIARKQAAAALKRKQARKPTTKTGTAKTIAGSPRATAKPSRTAASKTREPQTTRTPSKNLTGVQKKADKQPPSSTLEKHKQQPSPAATPKAQKPHVRRGPGKKVVATKGTITNPSPSTSMRKKKSGT